VMLVTGGLAGFASGSIIAYFKTTPLIVTLGMMSIAQAIALILSNGVPIYNVPEALTDTVGFGNVLGIPSTVVISSMTMIASSFLLRRTIFGRYIYAIGSSRSAAEKSGIDVRFYTMLVYIVAGVTSGIGALVLTAWVGAAQPVAAPTLTLQSLAAVVLGGVALTGGSGSILQVFYGVLILGMLSNAMNMIGISDFYQTLAVGVVIILAVILDRVRREHE
jgi:ribose transport system permease protein